MKIKGYTVLLTQRTILYKTKSTALKIKKCLSLDKGEDSQGKDLKIFQDTFWDGSNVCSSHGWLCAFVKSHETVHLKCVHFY